MNPQPQNSIRKRYQRWLGAFGGFGGQHSRRILAFRAPEGFTDFGKSIPTLPKSLRQDSKRLSQAVKAASEILKLPITTRKTLEGSSTPRKEALNPEHCENTNYAPDILKPTTRNYTTNPEPATPRCCSTVSPSKSS